MTDAARPGPHLRLPARQAVLGLVSDVDPSEVLRAAQRLAAAYCGVPGLEGLRVSSIPVPAARAAIVVLANDFVAVATPRTVVWGLPIGVSGAATDDEIDRVLDAPGSVTDLAGVFVLVRIAATSVRLVTSTDFFFTLRRCRGAFATRAIAALALAGVAARVDRSALVEAVAWQAVLHGGEVLADVTAREEGTLVEVDAGGVRERVLAPLAQRLAPAGPPTPAEFRELLAHRITRAALVPHARLALTQGRDSVLAASCLASSGGEIATYTLGYRGYPDSRGAAAVARRLGWTHELVGVRDARGRHISNRRNPPVDACMEDVTDWLIRYAPWCEGLQQPRDALIGHVRWSAAHVASLTGHGGEVGRAPYWGGDADADPVQSMITVGPGGHLPDAARRHFADVIASDVALAADIGRADAALDVVYMRRQRTWLDHSGLPDASIANVLPQYLSADICRLLIDVPREDRRSSRFFDAAIGLDTYRLADTALKAASGERSVAPRGWLRPHRTPNDWPLLSHVIRQFDPGGWLSRDVLGATWWRWATDGAASQPWIRGLLWNAVAVEALHRWCG